MGHPVYESVNVEYFLGYEYGPVSSISYGSVFCQTALYIYQFTLQCVYQQIYCHFDSLLIFLVNSIR